MKKTLLILSAAAMTLGMASCAKDEPISVNEGAAINFRPSLGTRATETTNANLSEITVAGFMGTSQYFNPLLFTKASDGYFESSPEYNWPGDDTELIFYAYSPATPGGTVTLTPDAKTLTGFSPAADIASQVDFITASASGKRSVNETSGVPLTFNHMLSQIEVLAKTDNTAYTYKVTGVRIGENVSKGDFDFTTSSWTLGTDKAYYDETYTTPVTLGAAPVSVMGTEGAAMLIPQTLTPWAPATDASNTAGGAYLAIRLQINTTAGAQVYPFPSDTQCEWAAIPIDKSWEPGKKYVYTLDLTHGAGYVDPHDPQPGTPVLGGPIDFTVSVADWTDSAQDLPMNTGDDKTAD
ncbi:MAG: fimbrillin family protein [Bacteroides sp.]|nr:fimbrillin family protein [Bacteroides sp.]